MTEVEYEKFTTKIRRQRRITIPTKCKALKEGDRIEVYVRSLEETSQ